MLIKRVFDVIFALFGLMLLSPLFIIIALAIKLNSPGSILFKQTRVGLHQKLFKIHKFRTMYTGSESLGKLTIGHDDRITHIGRLLRKTKLDELPQLFDVLIGNMSLVGPRPEVPEYVNAYPPNAKQIIFSIKPGITDFASLEMIDENLILGSSNNPDKTYITEILPRKIELSMMYVQTHNLKIDFLIILKTFIKILTR